MPDRLGFSPSRSGLNPRSIHDLPCKQKNKIGHSCLKKSVTSPRKSEEVSDQPETQLVYPRQDRCGIVSQSWLNCLLVGNDRELSEEV